MLADDDISTLEAALAFVDAHFPSVPSQPNGDSHGADASSRPVDSLRKEPLPAPPSTKAAKKRARDIQAAARTNRKKRAELLELRALAAALETRRDALRVLRGGPSDRRSLTGVVGVAGGPSHDASASEVATMEACRLNKSRALNRRLRITLEHQRSVAVSVIQALKKRMDLKCVQDLLQETRVYGDGLSVSPVSSIINQRPEVVATMSNGRCALSQDLPARLQALSSEAVAALAAMSRGGTLTESHTRIVRHPGRGPVIEMVASTLIPCGLDDGWEHVTGVLGSSFPSSKAEAVSCVHQQRLECGVSERDYSMSLPSSHTAVDGITLFEVFESPDAKLFVYTSVVAVRGGGAHVRERGWTAMTRSAASGCCTLHNRYELHTATTDATTDANGAKAQLLAESLLQQARQNRSRLESSMATRFGSDVSCAALLLR